MNLGGADNRLVNEGLITTTADPRNGTVYGDITALNIEIENRGLIDVGEGNNGDAISLELGPFGHWATSSTPAMFRVEESLWATTKPLLSASFSLVAQRLQLLFFQGDIENQGLLAAEHSATLVIENRYANWLDSIINSGLIDGGLSAIAPSGQLAIDGREAVGGLTVVNTGAINGDIFPERGG